jgi:RNA polymerase sigma-70 factor (ECF subfamily)
MTAEHRPSDPTLDDLALAKAGDRKAYERLFLNAADRVLLYIRLRLGPALRSKVESGDMLQEAYLEAFRDIGQFEPRDAGAFCRWLCRIAEHCIHGMADHFGAQKRQAPGGERVITRVLEEARAAGHGPATTLARREGRARLEQALERLEREDREVLLLRYFEERTVEEIALATGRSPTAVRRLLGRAHLKLSDELKHAGTNR